MKIRNLLALGLLALGTVGTLGAMGSQEGGSPAASDKIVYEQGFETDTDGFTGRGPNERLTLTGIPAHTGKNALTVDHRTSTWNGPMKDLTRVFRAGRTYHIEFWGRYDVGPDFTAITTSFQKSVEGAGDVFETIGAGQLPRGQWTKFEMDYAVGKDTVVSSWKLYFETPYKADSAVKPDDLVTFAIDDLKITRIPTAVKQVRKDIPAFQASFPAGMHIGTALLSDHLNSENIHYDLLRHFNTFVYGNEMKQDATEPREGAFRFGAADALVKFAQQRKVSLRGHTLLWHNQVPGWLFQDKDDPSKPASKELLLSRIENHIKTLVGRYKGQFYAWDVVNEAIGDNGDLRQSPYYKICGDDSFIEMAFRWAHEADPDAILVLNDYNVEYGGAKQDGLYRELKSLLDRGVPVSAVGLQSHISIGRPTVNDFKATIERFSSLGIDVQITELDVSIYESGSEPRKAPTRDNLTDQALKYGDLFRLFAEENRAGRLSTVLIWGMSDDETWLDNFPTPGRTDHPLLFDKSLQPKPAYWAVVDPRKMPVVIQRADAFQADHSPAGPADEAWGNVSPRPVKDAQGQAAGWFKTLWTPAGLSVLAQTAGPAAPGDAVTAYLDPANTRSKQVPAGALKVDLAAVEGPEGTFYQATLPWTGVGKPMVKVGFDLKITRAAGNAAWTDSNFTQDQSAENWGVLTLKPMPALVAVTKGTPKVEGNPDPLWANAVTLPLNVESQSDAAPGSFVKLLWDEGHLYALFEIKDPVLNDKAANPYEQDSVELFLDQNNQKTTGYQPDDGQYRVSFRNLATFNGGQKEGFKSATRLIPGGFRVVMAVPLYTVAGAPGVLYGFDAQENNADSNAVRVGIRNWVDGTNQGYQNTSGWGILKLVP